MCEVDHGTKNILGWLLNSWLGILNTVLRQSDSLYPHFGWVDARGQG